ncbi:cysteine peptidase family C39 domain-containing protein [Massilia mucilaginosa]
MSKPIDAAAGLGVRLPSILQTEAAECGLACLAMIAAYHGNGTDLAHLRRRFGMSLRGATLKDLVGIGVHLGLASRPLRPEPDELEMLATPCILHWDLNHFVVLKQVTAKGVVIHDPAVGVRRLPRATVLKHFTGVALELSPTAAFESGQARPRVRLAALLGRMTGIRQSLFALAVMALAIEVLAVVSPFFMQWVVDEALVSADRDLLLTLALGFAFLLIIRVAVTAARGATLIAISSTIKVAGRASLFGHLVSLPAVYFESRHLGDIMSRFGSQEVILQAITTDMVEILLDGLMAAITGRRIGGHCRPVRLRQDDLAAPVGQFARTGSWRDRDRWPCAEPGRPGRIPRAVGVVMQDDQLFAGSIADNISFFADAPSMERIRDCARLAAVEDDVNAMPMGFHTLIGDMGTVLSGGQKQRILIARALYREPVLLLLDEATSHLDVMREQAVNAAIHALPMTRIIVAHRRETILSAERIIVLEEGQVACDLRGEEGRAAYLARMEKAPAG